MTSADAPAADEDVCIRQGRRRTAHPGCCVGEAAAGGASGPMGKQGRRRASPGGAQAAGGRPKAGTWTIQLRSGAIGAAVAHDATHDKDKTVSYQRRRVDD